MTLDPTLSRAERSVLRTLALYGDRPVVIADAQRSSAYALRLLGLAERAGAGAYRITEEGRRTLQEVDRG